MNVEHYLSCFFKGTKNPSLAGTHYFMDKLGHPEEDLKIVHIAGTNGKGSCTQMMSNILIKSGYTVGTFISPHLIHYNERISINHQNISDKEMKELIIQLEPIIEEYNAEHDMKITLFELETTMALLYFARKKCDFVVLEVGLGGMYDCTNIVHPLVSIITSIGYDHMHILGNTLEKITEQKAGIIKENSNTVFLENIDSINQIIQEKCRKENNSLHLVLKESIQNISYDKDYLTFDYKDYTNVKINLKGMKQVENAALCLETCAILKKDYLIEKIHILEGLETVIHKARFEIISTSPAIIFDGAHNAPAIENFNKSVNMYYPNEKKIYIISLLRTKDHKAVLKNLIKSQDDLYIFTSGSGEDIYYTKEDLYEMANSIYSNYIFYKYEIAEAIKLIKEKYVYYITFIVGSFYVYPYVVNLIK